MQQLGYSLDAVNLRDVFEDDDSIHLVMELCEGGALLERIESHKWGEGGGGGGCRRVQQTQRRGVLRPQRARGKRRKGAGEDMEGLRAREERCELVGGRARTRLIGSGGVGLARGSGESATSRLGCEVHGGRLPRRVALSLPRVSNTLWPRAAQIEVQQSFSVLSHALTHNNPNPQLRPPLPDASGTRRSTLRG